MMTGTNPPWRALLVLLLACALCAINPCGAQESQMADRALLEMSKDTTVRVVSAWALDEWSVM